MPPRRYRGLSQTVIDVINERTQAPELASAAAVLKDLENDPRLKGLKLPEERAIQRDLQSRRSKDDSAPWSLADASPEDVAIVLPVLAETIKVNEGRRKHLTLDEVKWIKKIHAAVPEFDPWDIYVRALQYRRAVASKDEDRLRQLAIRPWESAERANVWAQAFGVTSHGPTGSITLSDYAIPRHAQKAHEESDKQKLKQQKLKGGTGHGKTSTR
jgi:hypothetical protein